MLGKISRLLRPAQPVARLAPRLERIVAVVGHGIDEAEGFAMQAQAALDFAFAYFDRQLSAIPGPFALPAQDSGTPVAPLFPQTTDPARALGRSLAVRDELPALAAAGHELVYALLGVRLRSTQTDPGQFTDHTLRSLAPTPAEVLEQLRQAAFERLLRDFSEHVDTLRRKERLLAIEWEWNQRHEAARALEPGEPPQFVYAAQELTPPKLLQGLVDRLHAPAQYLRVDRVRKAEGASPAVTADDLPRLHSSDRREWRVCLVAVPLADAQQALSGETHTHRYLLI